MKNDLLFDTYNSALLKEDLRKLGADILAPGDFHDRLAPAVMTYADILFGLTGIDGSDDNREHISTGHGRAIGTIWAALCIRQVIRTQRFCRGLHQAICDVLAKQPLRAVHVIYAGTGPFATLALPVMLQFKPEEVQFTLLEINTESITQLRLVLQKLDVEAYVRCVELCDATQWKVPDEQVDIVISETMERALQTEPQVDIMLNMVKQLPAGVIYIPEEISVGLAFKKRGGDKIEQKTNLYSFNKVEYQDIIKRSAGKPAWVFDKTAYNYTPVEDKHLVYTTDIKVYGANELHYPDCSLNFFQKVKPELTAHPATIRFQYQDGEMPGFGWVMD
jgi:ubiquinone/menaquinone biosynthesis C-methylase UbiE